MQPWWPSVQGETDPMIPTDFSDAMCSHLHDQLLPQYGSDAAQLARQLTHECKSLAGKVAQSADAERWRLGSSWTDGSCGVVQLQCAGGESEIRCTAASNETHSLKNWSQHLSKLAKLHSGVLAGASNDLHGSRFLPRVFNVLQRYKSYSRLQLGDQAALPVSATASSGVNLNLEVGQAGVFEALIDQMGVRHECFASPLSSYMPQFGSLFVDVDHWFGSSGSFFDTLPTTGSFQVNHPSDRHSVESSFQHMLLALEHSSWQSPLSFVVLVPVCYAEDPLNPSLHPAVADCMQYVSCRAYAEAGCHQYTQYQMSTDSYRSQPVVQKPTALYILQNAAGRSQWPVDAPVVKQLLSQFFVDPSFAPQVKFSINFLR